VETVNLDRWDRQVKSRSNARRISLGLILAISLVLGTIPPSASATVVIEPFPDALAPTVTLDQPTPRSNNTTPSFSGTASEATPVSVNVYQGRSAEGTPIVTLKVQKTEPGSWASANVSPPLTDGKYTAVATQPGSFGSPTGVSNSVTFEIDTQPPTVTLKAPPSPSNDTTPSFSGTASEATQVTVELFEGTKPEGSIVATATASASAGSWTSGPVTPALPSGIHTFTALATQASGIGNGAGKSAPVTFVVDTEPPTVTLKALPSPSGDATPTFSGTASDHTAITLDIYRGGHAEGAVVAFTTAEGDNGEWVSAKASSPLEWGEYTAVATQPSSIGNPSGASSPMTFAVAPIAPTVATEGASAVTRASAALYASVDPEGAGVSDCRFEYGTTLSYGESIECGFVSEFSAFPPSGTTAVPVFARIYALSPSTTYHFRIVALGEGGTAAGADQTFTTLPPWVFNEGVSAGGHASVQSGSQSAHGSAASGVLAFIARQLKPRGRTARIDALLTTGVFSALFKAPGAGRAVVAWYYQPPGARRSGRPAPAPVLAAAGALRFRAARTAALKIQLTSAGRRLLSGAGRIRLTARCVFTPAGATPVRTSATFELTR
jgi:Bacterial Ig-like domain